MNGWVDVRMNDGDVRCPLTLSLSLSLSLKTQSKTMACACAGVVRQRQVPH